MISARYNGKPFSSYVGKSFFLHGLLVAIMLLISYQSFQIFKEKRSESIRIIERSVRVDVVSMPKMTIKELKSFTGTKRQGARSLKPVPVKKVEATNPNEIEFKKKKKNVSFADMLKNIGKKKIKNKAKPLPKKVIAKKGESEGDEWGDLKDLVVEGNQLSEGHSIVGTGKGGSNTKFEKYLLSMPDKIKPFWNLPGYLKNQNLSCKIRVYLAKSGKIIKASIYESSGNKEYDNRAMAALNSAAPFPRLADEFIHRGINGDIVLAFPL